MNPFFLSSSQIHSVDVEVLTALCSFLEYSPSLPPPPPNLPSPHEVEASSFDQLETGQLVELQFNLSSLYPKCHVSAFTFSAFTESKRGRRGRERGREGGRELI